MNECAGRQESEQAVTTVQHLNKASDNLCNIIKKK